MSASAAEGGHPVSGTGASSPALRRPIAVTFVAILALIVGTYDALDGLVVLAGGGDANELAGAAFDLALGAVAIVIGAGAFRMKRWAWAALMTWAMISLTHQLLRYFFYGHPDHLTMALDTVVVLALTPLDVQIAFGARPSRNVTLAQIPRNPIDST